MSSWTSRPASAVHGEAFVLQGGDCVERFSDCTAGRIADIDGAHVAYLSEIYNPIGIKIAPDTTPEHLITLLDRLDPDHSPGRISLITRLGREGVTERLPRLNYTQSMEMAFLMASLLRDQSGDTGLAASTSHSGHFIRNP